MDDPDLGFDLNNMKKKKKKKKTPIGFDADLGAGAAEAPTEAAEAVPAEDAAAAAAGGAAAAAAAADDVTDDLGAFNPSMKKKKKKKKAAPEFDALAGAESGDVLVDDATSGAADEAEASADHDYTYQELLDRVFEIMRAKDPGGGIGERPKFVLKPPQVTRIGTRKTSFVNFTEICKLLHRQPKHLLAFICAELGTSGSVDANNQLIIRGRYQQKQIESVLRRYIKEYVTCHTCRSPETILQKETRLFFLQCERCNSRCSVATIKSGFQAVTQKRAAQRAKQQ